MNEITQQSAQIRDRFLASARQYLLTGTALSDAHAAHGNQRAEGQPPSDARCRKQPY
jgi:hypothetical protein